MHKKANGNEFDYEAALQRGPKTVSHEEAQRRLAEILAKEEDATSNTDFEPNYSPELRQQISDEIVGVASAADAENNARTQAGLPGRYDHETNNNDLTRPAVEEHRRSADV